MISDTGFLQLLPVSSHALEPLLSVTLIFLFLISISGFGFFIFSIVFPLLHSPCCLWHTPFYTIRQQVALVFHILRTQRCRFVSQRTEMTQRCPTQQMTEIKKGAVRVLGACSPLDGTLLGGSLFSPNVCHERLSLPSPSSLGAEPHAQAPGSCPGWGRPVGQPCHGTMPPAPCHRHCAIRAGLPGAEPHSQGVADKQEGGCMKNGAQNKDFCSMARRLQQITLCVT